MTQNGNGTTQSTPSGTICAEEYVVKRGDSFYLIAHKLGVPLRDLLAANREIHPARLMVGDVLCVPREEDDAPTEGGLQGATGGNATNAASGSGSAGGSASDLTNSSASGTQNAAAGNGSSGTNGSATQRPADSDTSTERPETLPDGTTATRPNGTSSANQPSESPSVSQPDPTTDEATAESDCGTADRVTVESGQTVADIQLSHLVSRHTLDTANPKLNLDSLRQGQVLCVPVENVPCALPSTYVLGAGETLDSVAVRFNLPIGTLLRANPCLAPQDFEEGTSIILPK